jgi:lysine decarboxylase
MLGEAVFAADVWPETGSFDRDRRAAEELAADAWGAERAWILGNGSSAGNLAWAVACLRDGEPVLVSRDAHTSLLTGLVLSGARPIWLQPMMGPDAGLSIGITPGDLDAALRRRPGTGWVAVTAPGYSGAGPELPELAATAHRHGARLYVDQAWGAHLAFHPALPVDAMAAGADAAVVSVHKTGAALSSGAVLLARSAGVAGGTGAAGIDTAVRMTQTTSPLLPLLASVDAARRDLATIGQACLDAVLPAAEVLADGLRGLPGLRVPSATDLGVEHGLLDPLKLVIDVRAGGWTGWQVERAFRSRGLAPEGADHSRVFLALSALDRDPDRTAGAILDAVRAALPDLPVGPSRPALPDQGRGAAPAAPGAPDEPTTPETVLTPRQAHQSRHEVVPLDAAVGRVAAERAVPYPPGIPVLLPGEVVTAGVVRALRRTLDGGGHVHGRASGSRPRASHPAGPGRTPHPDAPEQLPVRRPTLDAVQVWQAIAIAGAGVGAGVINTVAGSGTLITFPTLLALGYPPVTANVSNSLGLAPGGLAGAWGYRRELVGQRATLVRLVPWSVAGG